MDRVGITAALLESVVRSKQGVFARDLDAVAVLQTVASTGNDSAGNGQATGDLDESVGADCSRLDRRFECYNQHQKISTSKNKIWIK